MLLFITLYIIFLVLEIISEIVQMKRGEKHVLGTLLPTIFGFSFAATSISSEMCTTEDSLKILFIYSILYTIYWIVSHALSINFNKNK